jgi:general secretion pathway protein E
MGIRRVELDESFKAEGVQGDAVQKARTLALKKEIPLRQALLETEGINESAMARAFSNLSGLPVVESIELANIQVEHIRILPHNIARDAELLDDPNQAPIIRFVNAVLSQAIKERASDIHVEPYERTSWCATGSTACSRSRIGRPPSSRTHRRRIKIMAGLNIAEKRLPQDGRIRRKMGGREIDLRVRPSRCATASAWSCESSRRGGVLARQDRDARAHARAVPRAHPAAARHPARDGPHRLRQVHHAVLGDLPRSTAPDINILTIEDPSSTRRRASARCRSTTRST